MKYHKPLPVKTTYITADGIPTSSRSTPAGAPMPTHGGGTAGKGGGGNGTTGIDWTAERPNVEVCASNVFSC